MQKQVEEKVKGRNMLKIAGYGLGMFFLLWAGYSLITGKTFLIYFGVFFALVAFAVANKERLRKFFYEMPEDEVRDTVPLSQHLNNVVVGQEEAVKHVSSTLLRNVKKQEMKGLPKRVLATFMFVGPTGVGKTQTAKALAGWFGYYYGHQFLRFDMGNFSDYHTAQTLVGSPKGYIGSEEGGALTRPLMHNPKAVILFDEIEKAHPSLYKPLMALVDEGEIQELSTGIRVVLNQSIIIFTSNLWQNAIRYISENIEDEVEKEILIRNLLTGNFLEVSRIVPQHILEEDYRRFTGDSRSETQHFPPEFIGRIEKIVTFKPLDDLALATLVVRKMEELGIVRTQEDVNRLQKEIWDLTWKYREVADKYGVRVFLRKVEEELL